MFRRSLHVLPSVAFVQRILLCPSLLHSCRLFLAGPYKYKELTALIEFQPDDVNKKEKEQYLDEDEFQELFGCVLSNNACYGSSLTPFKIIVT